MLAEKGLGLSILPRQNAEVPHSRPAVGADPRHVKLWEVTENPVHLLFVESSANHNRSAAGPRSQHSDHL